MDNKNQNTNQNTKETPRVNTKENSDKMRTKIKETWSGLSDTDIKLYDTKRADFFAKVKEKHGVSKEDAQKKLQQIEKDCGCSSSTKAA